MIKKKLLIFASVILLFSFICFVSADTTQFTTDSVEGVDMAPLTNTSFVIAWCDETANAYNFAIYKQDGTVVKTKTKIDDTLLCEHQKVGVSVFPDTNNFVIGYSNTVTDNKIRFAIYNSSGSLLNGPTLVKNYGASFLTSSIDVATMDNNTFVIGWNQGNASIKYYNSSGSNTTTEIQVNTEYASNAYSVNLDALNSTDLLVNYYLNANGSITKIYDNAGNQIIGEMIPTVSGYTDSLGTRVTAINDSYWALGYYDVLNEDIDTKVYNYNTNTTENIIVQNLPSVSEAIIQHLAITTLSDTKYALAWPRSNSGIKNATFQIMYTNGTAIGTPTMFAAALQYTGEMAITSYQKTSGIGFTGDSFVVAWSNATAGYFRAYEATGVECSGLCSLLSLNITYPQNISYKINVSALNFTNTNAVACWYSTDAGATNTTTVCGTNLAGLTSTEGSNTWLMGANGTAGDATSTTVTFFKDTVYPLISITSPANNSNTTVTNLTINYTRSDTNLGSCWYTRNLGTTNTTLANCTNITGVTWNEGLNNITIYVNDTVGNVNSSSVTFRLDTTAPTLSILFPVSSTTYYTHNQTLNFSVSDSGVGLSSCWKRLNSGANVTISCTANSTVNSTSEGTIDGSNTIYMWANDTLNNVASTSITYGVSIAAPAINLDYPTSNMFYNTNNNLYFNFTATSVPGLDTCELWGNWSGGWHKNYTWVGPTSAVQNFTTLNLSDGIYKYNIWCNDTTNNPNWALTNFTFGVDSAVPNVTINQVIVTVSSTIIQFNSTEVDTNLNTCKYSVWLGGTPGTNTTFTCNSASLINVDVGGFGTYTLYVYANDSAGNENYSSATFTTTVSTPVAPSGGGGSSVVTYLEANATRWTMKTEQKTGNYQFSMSAGSSRTRGIRFENTGIEDRTVTLTCEGTELCNYITFKKTSILLPIGLEIPSYIYFDVNIPSNMETKSLTANIIGIDEKGGKNILTIVVDVRPTNILLDNLNKMGESKMIGNFPVPYFVIFFFSWAVLTFVFRLVGLRKIKSLGTFIAVMLAGIVSFVLLAFI